MCCRGGIAPVFLFAASTGACRRRENFRYNSNGSSRRGDLRFYRIPFVSEIFGCDRRESFLFSMEGFPKYLGAAYVDEKGHFVIQVLGDSAKARKQIVEAVGSDEVTVIPRRNSRQLLDSLYAYLCEIRRFRADEPTVAVFDTVCYDARDSWTIYVHVKALDYTMPEYVDSLYRYIGEFRKKVLLSRWVQVEGKYTVVTGVDLDEIKVKE